MNYPKKNNKIINKKAGIVSGIVLLTVSGILLSCAKNIPGFAQWYAVNVYSVLVGMIGRFFGYFPISVVEMLLYISMTVLILAAIKTLKGLRCRRNVKEQIYSMTGVLFFSVVILFFLYAVNCGVNYYRDSFAYSTGLEIDSYSTEELEILCRTLTKEVNFLSDRVRRDGQGVMRLTENEQEEAVRAIQQLAEIYPELKGYYPQPKRLMIPWILSVQQISGIYSPFTVEANYNNGMVDYNIPFTACHELSHLRGFMREEEANFIAYLACLESDSIEFRYSGSLMGWVYCTNALYRNDFNRWKEIRSELCEAANRDLKENSAYWDKYEGKTAEIADKVNDNYLKANGQSDGIKSYGRMVDLMVAYYRRY